MVDTLMYKEWFETAKKDLKGAKILYEHNAVYLL
jgi:HEPN domain-containing protein